MVVGSGEEDISMWQIMSLLDCNVELLALTRAKSSTLQPNKQVLVY